MSGKAEISWKDGKPELRQVRQVEVTLCTGETVPGLLCGNVVQVSVPFPALNAGDPITVDGHRFIIDELKHRAEPHPSRKGFFLWSEITFIPPEEARGADRRVPECVAFRNTPLRPPIN